MSYAKWWTLALSVIVTAFLAFSLPTYLSVDPARSRVPATFALHYPLLVAHVLVASVAMITAVLQIWPGLRARRPRLHRRTGRVYLAAVVPAATSALVIGVLTPFGPILAASNVVLAVLWLWFTANGYRAARRRDIPEHRRNMTLSATLALSVITNRIWAPVLYVSLQPLRDSVFGGDGERFGWLIAGLAGWLGWSIPLVLVWWWMRRRGVMARSLITPPQHPSPV
jgi:uncharacterized membrane protein